VAACRSRCGRLARRRRSAFFSTAAQGDDHGPWVAVEAADLGLRDEAGEAVDVQETLEFGHPRIVTSLPGRRKADFTGKYREKRASAIGNYPHDFTKNHFMLIKVFLTPC
jgi:hypothetical protein